MFTLCQDHPIEVIIGRLAYVPQPDTTYRTCPVVDGWMDLLTYHQFLQTQVQDHEENLSPIAGM